jgi:hemerythrin-like domain-containing protein
MQNDLFNILHHDHETVMDIISRLERSPGNRQTLFDQLRLEIRAHTRGEEYAFYPRFIDHPQAEMLVRQAVREHRRIENILNQMKGTSLSSPEWIPLTSELKTRVQEHVRLEENELFDIAQKVMSNREFEEITAEFISEKEQITGAVPGTR